MVAAALKAETNREGTLNSDTKKIDTANEVRSIARERVGPIPAPKVIKPKADRAKPKHKKPIGPDSE